MGNLTPAAAAQQAFDLFGVDDPSPATRQVLEQYVAGEQAARRQWSPQPMLVVLTVLSPDFQLS